MASLNYYTLQKAIYEKLIANSSLMAVVSGIYDQVPQGSVYPLVTISALSSSEFSSLGKTGGEYQVDIDIWSREGGHKQAADIMDTIYSILHNGNIAVTGQTLSAMRVISAAIDKENDGLTSRAAIRVKIILINS